MRINHKILSIPPYVSASWKNIASLSTLASSDNTFDLDILLQDGSQIKIPSMDRAIVDAIFEAHAKFLENEASSKQPPQPSMPAPFVFESNSALMSEEGFDFPFPVGFLAAEEVRPFMQHDAAFSNLPPLPVELVSKITALTRSLNLETVNFIPKAEPHCNCPHCQITRCITSEIEEKNSQNAMEEEEISDDDLRFTSWIIRPLTNDCYEVSHPDHSEKNIVSLQSPIHCSCEISGCEHIKAVLNS